MANAFSIIKIILLVFLILILVVMLVFFVQSVLAISRNESKKHNTNVAITTALVGANAILGILGTHREHFLFVLIFAILQTVLIVVGLALAVESWFAIPWVGSAILAFVFAFLIKQGHTAA